MRYQPIRNNESGLTLLELIIGFTILIGILVAIGLFASDIFSSSNLFTKSFEAQQEIQGTIQEMNPQIRSMGPSNIGSYPIAAAASSSLIFYSDIDNDGLFEQIRYFLSSNTFKKGVIKPTGQPLTYNPANEIIVDVVHNMMATTTGIFSYYDSNYTGSQPPMVFPVDISTIKTIGITISARDPSQNLPIIYSTQLTPRNLRN